MKIADSVNKINNLFNLMYNAETNDIEILKTKYMNELLERPY